MADTDTERVQLPLNVARVDFVNTFYQNAYVWTQYNECEGCPYFETPISVANNATKSKTINSYYTLKYAVSTEPQRNHSKICESIIEAQEQSIHRIIIENDLCRTEVAQEGRNEFYLLFVALGAILLVAGGFYGLRFVWRMFKGQDDDDENGALAQKMSTRLNCLDAFRGLSILLMIFCNWGSGQFLSMEHAAWDGLHFADFIFPSFIFIMGVTMSISLKSMVIKKELPLGKIYWTIAKRSAKLFLVGLILNSRGHPDIRYLRIPGVLQRFAVSFFIVSCVHVLSLHLSRNSNKSQYDYLTDITPYWPDWLLTLVMMMIYIILTFAWKFSPDCPTGYIGPGGMADGAKYPYCSGGAAAKLDELIFTKKHIYGHFTAGELYDPEGQYKVSHDPEGLLGCTTSVILTIIGLQIGKILLHYDSSKDRLIRMGVWILLLSSVGAIFSATEVIPINKNLWSLTFVCVTGATAITIFGLFYLLIDHFKIWPRGTPFHYPGMNSILLYIGHGFTGSLLPFSFIGTSSTHFWFLFQNITGVTMWMFISVYLAKKNIFFTL